MGAIIATVHVECSSDLERHGTGVRDHPVLERDRDVDPALVQPRHGISVRWFLATSSSHARRSVGMRRSSKRSDRTIGHRRVVAVRNHARPSKGDWMFNSATESAYLNK